MTTQPVPTVSADLFAGRRALSPREFGKLYGHGLSKTWAMIRDGEIAARKTGGRTLLFVEDILAWEQSLVRTVRTKAAA